MTLFAHTAAETEPGQEDGIYLVFKPHDLRPSLYLFCAKPSAPTPTYVSSRNNSYALGDVLNFREIFLGYFDHVSVGDVQPSALKLQYGRLVSQSFGSGISIRWKHLYCTLITTHPAITHVCTTVLIRRFIVRG